MYRLTLFKDFFNLNGENIEVLYIDENRKSHVDESNVTSTFRRTQSRRVYKICIAIDIKRVLSKLITLNTCLPAAQTFSLALRETRHCVSP